jgi:exopolysaccharide biosynthesis polyprenyl glycosylphosphotransferase
MNQFFSKTRLMLLFLVDVGLLFLSLWLMLILRFGTEASLMWQKHLEAFIFIYPFWFLSLYIFGLYDLKLAKNTSEFYLAILKATVLNGFISTTLLYLFPKFFGLTPRMNLFLNLLFFGVLVFLWHQIYNFFIKSPNLTTEVIIIGENPKALEIKERIDQNPQLGYKIISIIDPEKENLELEKEKNYTIVTSLNLNHYPKLAKKLYQYLPYFNFEKFSDFYERITGKVPLSQIDEVWFLDNLRERETVIYEKTKRIVDVLISLLALILTIILFPLIALLIKIESPGPVFYRQVRIGKKEKEIIIHKFRSMKSNQKENTKTWREKEKGQVTKVGSFLRKFHLDELPQSWAILKGDLSIVGPRPEWIMLGRIFEEEIPFYFQRYLVKPGITGWAQLHFPASLSVSEAKEKFKYDLYYIKNRSLLLDIEIILKTLNHLLVKR